MASRRLVFLGNVNAKVKSTVVNNPGSLKSRLWTCIKRDLELAAYCYRKSQRCFCRNAPLKASFRFSLVILLVSPKIVSILTDSSSRRCRRGERRRRSPRSRPNRPCKRGKRLRRNRNEPSASGSSDKFVHIKEVDLPIRIHKCLRVVGDVNVARLPRLGRSLFCLLA